MEKNSESQIMDEEYRHHIAEKLCSIPWKRVKNGMFNSKRNKIELLQNLANMLLVKNNMTIYYNIKNCYVQEEPNTSVETLTSIIIAHDVGDSSYNKIFRYKYEFFRCF